MEFSFAEIYGQLELIIPECVLLVFGIIAFVMGAGSKRETNATGPGVVAFIGLVATIIALIAVGRGQAFGVMFLGDNFAFVFKLIVLVAAMFTIASSFGIVNKFHAHRGEYFGVVAVSAVGMMFMVSAGELLTMYIALELSTISLFVLAAYHKFNTKSAEAGLKYVILGAISSAVLLYGIALIYGLTGTTEIMKLRDAIIQMRFAAGEFPRAFFVALLLLIAGFGFKLSLVPFHMWAPDVYEGAPTPITAYLSTASKAAGLAVFLRVFFGGLVLAQGEWMMIMATLAALAMIVGNVTAIVQRNIKRLLAFSSIAHIGYILVAIVATNELGVSSMTYYMMVYLFANMGAFISVIVFAQKTGSEQIADYSGLSRRSPVLAAFLSIFLLSLAGIPPLAGFFGKYYVFLAAIEQGWLWLVLIALLTSVVALYYYAYVIWRMYFTREGDYEDVAVPFPLLHKVVLSIAVIGIFVMGILPDRFLAFARTAAESFMR